MTRPRVGQQGPVLLPTPYQLGCGLMGMDFAVEVFIVFSHHKKEMSLRLFNGKTIFAILICSFLIGSIKLCESEGIGDDIFYIAWYGMVDLTVIYMWITSNKVGPIDKYSGFYLF